MTASSRGGRAAASLIRSSQHPRVCSNCISNISRRHYAVEAAVLKTTDGTAVRPTVAAAPPVTQSSAETDPYELKTGVVLSRPPLLTRPLTKFEESFYFYQKRLNERLAMPFTRYFYFKKDTPADHDWKRKAKLRNGTAARELGGYQAYSKEAWNDELLAGDKLSEHKTMVSKLVEDAKTRSVSEDGQEYGAYAEEVDDPLERYTEADQKKDFRRLDRRLARTLYLLVKTPNGGWRFPSGPLLPKENLHQAAERILVQTGGINMNTWIVGHAPIGHLVSKPRFAQDASVERPGEKVFFMKGRIMAGQANLENNQFGWEDYKWLTRQELQGVVGPWYYSHVKNMLPDR